MGISYEDADNTLRRISLSGHLDIPGTSEIDLKLTTLSASAKHRVVLDLTAVTFLASIGIRSIISSAKALQQRGGKMVLLVGSNDAIGKILQTTGVDTLLPMFSDAAEADSAALA